MADALERGHVLPSPPSLITSSAAAHVTGRRTGLRGLHPGALGGEVDVEEALLLGRRLADRGHPHHVAPIVAEMGAAVDHDQVARLITLSNGGTFIIVYFRPSERMPMKPGREFVQPRHLGEDDPGGSRSVMPPRSASKPIGTPRTCGRTPRA